MSAAADDLELPAAVPLYHRFVAWTLDRDQICRVCGKHRHNVIPGLPPRLSPCGKIPQLMQSESL
jgi:hypothetical protein